MLHRRPFLVQGHAHFGELDLRAFDLSDLLLSDGRVGLHQPEAHRRLAEVVRGKHKQQRVGAQLHAVGLLDHAGVLVFQGRHMTFERSELRVGATHGAFQRPNRRLVVPHKLLAQLNFLVEQTHLLCGVVAVALRLVEQILCGFELLRDAVAFLLKGRLVVGLGKAIR